MEGLYVLLDSIKKSDEDLYTVDLFGYRISFVLPSLKKALQYQTLLSLSDSESDRMIIYEHIFVSCVKDDLLTIHGSNIPAGIPESIARTILFLSGVDNNSPGYTEEMFDIYRNLNDLNTPYMKRTICQAFPGYTFESLDKITYQQLVSNFIHAEKILMEQGIIEVPFTCFQKQAVKEKKSNFNLEEIIRQDAMAQQNFNAERAEVMDIERKKYMQKVREDAIKRAKEEELAHMRKYSR